MSETKQLVDLPSSIDVEDGELPSGWQPRELKFLGSLVTGSTPSSKTTGSFGNDCPFVAPGDIGWWSRLGEVKRGLSTIGMEQVRLVEGPSVLLVCIGTIGKVAWTDQTVATNQQINALSVDETVCSAQYVSLALASATFQEQLRRHSSSTTVSIVNKKKLSNLSIPLAPLPEQERIVEILKDQLSRLDTALHSVHTVREKAARFRRSLLHAAFTGALTGHDVEEGELPDVWELSPLGDQATVVMGQAPPGSECNRENMGTPFVKVGEFGAEFPSVREWTTKPLRMAAPNDVLICVVGATAGKINRSLECAIGRSVAALRPTESLNSSYLFHHMSLRTLEMRSGSRGSAQGVITKKDLETLEIPIPSLPEQDRIVEILEDQLSRLDASLAVADAVEERSAALRRSLLHSAFTGRLTEEWREAVNV
jgi:restriction endonuclease S subunit